MQKLKHVNTDRSPSLEGVEYRVYEGVSNPIKSGFAFLYEDQYCVGSYGLTSCQTGKNYK